MTDRDPLAEVPATDRRRTTVSADRETAETDLLRLVQAAIQAHRDLHMIYGSTATCGGGIGGQAMTQHCGVTCGYFEQHEADNNRWCDVERAYFRRQEGDPEWADYIPGGRLSTTPTTEEADR